MKAHNRGGGTQSEYQAEEGMEDVCKTQESADPDSACRLFRKAEGMQGRSLHAHVQLDTFSACGLFRSVSIAGGGMLRKCRGDCSIHVCSLQQQRRAELLMSYAPSPTASFGRRQGIRPDIDQRRSWLGKQNPCI